MDVYLHLCSCLLSHKYRDSFANWYLAFCMGLSFHISSDSKSSIFSCSINYLFSFSLNFSNGLLATFPRIILFTLLCLIPVRCSLQIKLCVSTVISTCTAFLFYWLKLSLVLVHTSPFLPNLSYHAQVCVSLWSNFFSTPLYFWLWSTQYVLWFPWSTSHFPTFLSVGDQAPASGSSTNGGAQFNLCNWYPVSHQVFSQSQPSFRFLNINFYINLATPGISLPCNPLSSNQQSSFTADVIDMFTWFYCVWDYQSNIWLFFLFFELLLKSHELGMWEMIFCWILMRQLWKDVRTGSFLGC